MRHYPHHLHVKNSNDVSLKFPTKHNIHSFRHKKDMLQGVAGHKLYIHFFFNNWNHIGFGISWKVLKKTLNHMTLWKSTALTPGLNQCLPVVEINKFIYCNWIRIMLQLVFWHNYQLNQSHPVYRTMLWSEFGTKITTLGQKHYSAS